MSNELPYISAEQGGLDASVNKVQSTTIQLNFDEIKRLKQVDPHCSEVIKICKDTIRQFVDILIWTLKEYYV